MTLKKIIDELNRRCGYVMEVERDDEAIATADEFAVATVIRCDDGRALVVEVGDGPQGPFAVVRSFRADEPCNLHITALDTEVMLTVG